MPLTAGTRLGNYEIISSIGKGGMGEVYKGKDIKLSRDVAIKVLLPIFARNPGRLARFEREAKILASLNHPNIGTIYTIEESSEGKALVKEFVPGEILKGPLPLKKALTMAVQIAEALEAAHDKGITQRDLKSGNVMVTPQGLVKVLDFGLAAVVRPDPTETGPEPPTLNMGMTEAGVARRRQGIVLYRPNWNDMMAVTVRTNPKGVVTDTPHQLFALQYSPAYAVAADGQKFLMFVRPDVTEPLTVVTNWQAGLKKWRQGSGVRHGVEGAFQLVDFVTP